MKLQPSGDRKTMTYGALMGDVITFPLPFNLMAGRIDNPITLQSEPSQAGVGHDDESKSDNSSSMDIDYINITSTSDPVLANPIAESSRSLHNDETESAHQLSPMAPDDLGQESMDIDDANVTSTMIWS